MLTIGIGKAGSAGLRRPRRRQSRFRWTYSSSPRAAAAAWATASETPSTALAPSRALFGVPSRATSAASSAGLIVEVARRSTAGAISRVDVPDGPRAPPGRRGGGRRRRAVPAPRAARCSPPTARSPGRPPRSTRSPRPPPSAGPASRAPRGPSAWRGGHGICRFVAVGTARR